MTGASYLVPAAAHVSFARTPVADGYTVTVDEGLVLRALATPGHTPTTPPTSWRRTGTVWRRSPAGRR